MSDIDLLCLLLICANIAQGLVIYTCHEDLKKCIEKSVEALKNDSRSHCVIRTQRRLGRPRSGVVQRDTGEQ